MIGNRLWTIGSAALVVVIVALGWFVAISPMLTQADAARLQARTIEAQNASQQESTAKLAASFAKLPELRTRLAALQDAIPESVDLDSFLDQAEKFAGETGVEIHSYAAAEAVAYGGGTVVAPPTPNGSTPNGPTPDSPTPGTPAADVTANTAGALTGKLFTIPVTIGVSGSPDQVLAFSAALQQAARQFLVTDVSFAATTQQSGTVAGSLFVLRASAVPGTAPGGAAPDPTTVASR